MVQYIFDPDVVHECSMLGLGKPKPEMFEVIAKALEERYPGCIDHTQPWIYSIAGGAMIQMKLYFASIFEYIMIWGTPIGSEGHSGRHLVGFWDTVIDGETWYYGEGQFEKSIYRPGDRIFVGKGQARAMNFTDGVWAVEYARGPLPTSIPFGLADEVLSTLDFSTALQTLGVYMSLIGRHWNNANVADSRLIRSAKKLGAFVPSILGPRLTRWLEPPPEIDGIPDNKGAVRPREKNPRAEVNAQQAASAARSRPVRLRPSSAAPSA